MTSSVAAVIKAMKTDDAVLFAIWMAKETGGMITFMQADEDADPVPRFAFRGAPWRTVNVDDAVAAAYLNVLCGGTQYRYESAVACWKAGLRGRSLALAGGASMNDSANAHDETQPQPTSLSKVAELRAKHKASIEALAKARRVRAESDESNCEERVRALILASEMEMQAEEDLLAAIDAFLGGEVG